MTGGRITLDGIDVRELSFADLRGSIGLVPQEPALFSGTVRDNIAYARPDASDDRRASPRRARRTRIEFIDRLPDGYGTRVGERGIKLSGGQRQRIALARVFLKDPARRGARRGDVEPGQRVRAAGRGSDGGAAPRPSTLIIAHRLRTVRRADRVLVLERGQVVEEGTHEELVGQSGLYGRLYQAELRE